MNRLFAGLFVLLLCAVMPLLGSDDREDDISDGFSNVNTNEEVALKKVMEGDDAALDEINNWIQENNAYAAQGAGETKAQLNQRILGRLKTVRESYESFLKDRPKYARGYL